LIPGILIKPDSLKELYTMNIALWIIQILLAFVFLSHGYLMLFPPATLQPGMAYILAIPMGFRRFIAVAESLGGIGLILPGLTRILPWLTPLAALGLVIVMIGAVVFHIPHKEYPNIVFNLVLLAMAAFTAYGRFVILPS
jgi:uncharacterized membrane protein YphA (DoxX/SURF4 family)